MAHEYDEEEIEEAQAALNLYPNACGFWDSPSGQDVLAIARDCKLESTNTNAERCEIYAEFVRQAMAEAA